MSRNYKIRDQEKLYFISFAVVHWIDVFVRPIYKDIIVDSLKYCIEHKGLEVYGWCIMTSHIHLIIGTQGDKMEDIIRDLKKYTSKEILKEIKDNTQESRKEWMLWIFEKAGSKNSNNKTYQFWQQHNHPIELSDNHTMQQKLDYLHANPVVAGFVSEPQAYVYCSAIDYSGGKGLVPLKILE
ncbi:transposase [Fulvivirga sp.]|uniref:REP-associated tyrosine transposase n=1 Tax=Fulvivirga sp. TaxID=1931237 RepID=UPI0032ED695C